MTRRKWVELHMPQMITDLADGGVYDCPCDGEYYRMPDESKDEMLCDMRKVMANDEICRECWDQEMIEEKVDKMNEDITLKNSIIALEHNMEEVGSDYISMTFYHEKHMITITISKTEDTDE